MLTPSSTDPNRENELKRKEKEPQTFMPDKRIVEWSPSGLVDVQGKHLGTDPRLNKEEKI